ncbi:MAG TPA: hypothetical protein VLC46_26895 [Thermoanaerobaculia bacterium]|jgi:hypothetical protein|nr:hypothetical protein [Thermoanaerobaculia bacterium]
MTLIEAKTALCNKLNINLSNVQAGSDALFADADLTDAVQEGVNLSWDYRGWDFTTDALKMTYSPPASGGFYVDYPNTFEDESISLLLVNDIPWTEGKRNFEDYQKYFGDNPNATDKFWTHFQRKWFANKNALTNGDELAVFGKLRAPTLAASGDLLPFSPDMDNNETSGNRAVVELAYASILDSKKKNDQPGAEAARKRAYSWLDNLWAPIAERRAKEQSLNRPFFDTPDFFSPGNRSGIGPTTIGNFP